jgi:hypothetical protein
VLYGYLRRWHEPGLGLDPFEWAHLERLGYARWLERGRLTDGMTVDLIFHTLDNLHYFARERPVHRADLRARVIQALQRRRIRPAREGQPSGLTDDEQRLEAALIRLEEVTNYRGGPHFTVDPGRGTIRPSPEADDVNAAWAAIRERWQELTTELIDEVTTQVTSERTLRLGEDRNAPVIRLGDQARYAAEASALCRELGEPFLSLTTTSRCRAASVRKWKQLALHRAKRRPSNNRTAGVDASSPSQRALYRADRGVDRETVELRVLRRCAELASDDPRSAARQERFHALCAKQRRRAAYRQMFMEQILRASPSRTPPAFSRTHARTDR